MRFPRSVGPATLFCLLSLFAFAAPVRAADPGFLPSDTEALLTINFRQILNSDLVKANQDVVGQLKAAVEGQLANHGVQGYLEKIGFDPFRDLTRITVSSKGEKLPEFILLEGKFNPTKIQETGEAAGKDNADNIKPIKIAGQNAFEIRGAPDEKPFFAGVVGTDKLVATSSKDAFAAALARFNGSKKSSLKKELRDAIEATGAKQSLSLVATGRALAKMTDDAPVPNIEALQGILQGVNALNIAITIEKNVNFELAVNSKDKESAEQMAKLAGVGLAASRMMLKKRAEAEAKYGPALDIVNTMRVTSKDNNFVLRGEIAAATLGKILKDSSK